MSVRARVNISDVASLKNEAETARELSKKFSSAVSCLEDMVNEAKNDSSKLEDTASKAKQKLQQIEVKESEIESEIERLNAEISGIEHRIADVEGKLADTPEYITKKRWISGDPETGEVGYYETETIENPKYIRLENKLEDLENEKSNVENERDAEAERLEHLLDVKSRLIDTLSEINSSINILDDCCRQCLQFMNELQELASANYSSSQEAFEKLGKIIKTINQYRNIKVEYNDIALTKNMSDSTISEFAPQYVSSPEPENVVHLSAEEIKEHDIKFDQYNRITQYDGKTFGGQYKTYEERLKEVPKNLMFGTFEGVYAESMFIPSSRTARGIEAIRELDNFGLKGINYRNGEPDFETCAYAVVKISDMSSYRDDNFKSADTVCAAMWNAQVRDGKSNWISQDVKAYRKANNLSWHEKCDTETMVLVKSIINEFFDHSGGVAECKARDGVKDTEEYDA